MRLLSILMIVGGSVVFAGSLFLSPPLECQLLKLTEESELSAPPSRWCDKPRGELEDVLASLEEHEAQLAARIEILENKFTQDMVEMAERSSLRRDESIIREPKELKDARLNRLNAIAEMNDIRAAMRVQDLKAGPLGAGVAAIGLVLFVVSFLLGRRNPDKVPSEFRKSVDIVEVEKWLPPVKAEALMGSLDASARDAIGAMWEIRPRTCGYCSARLPFTPAGRVEHVQIYKEAPTDVAKPKKISLGDGFRPIPVERIKCPDCGHENRHR